MPQWLVRLEGDEFDKKRLSALYSEPASRVALDDDGDYYLTSDTFATLAESVEVKIAAERMLHILNDLMRFRDQGYQPVSLDKIYKVNDDGTRSAHVFGSAIFSGSSRMWAEGLVIGPNGQPIPSPEPAIAQARLKLAQLDTRVKTVLALWRDCTPTDPGLWIYLYKIYELIGTEMAGGNKNQIKQALIGLSWATFEEIVNFGEAANNPDVTGEHARHAAGWRTESSITPMNADQAIAFIHHLIELWMDDKLKQTP